MAPDALLDDFSAAGVSLSLDGDRLHYQTRPGVSVAQHRERIANHKPALVAALELRAHIIAAAQADPAAFDRAAYDALWVLWHAQQAADGPSTSNDNLMRRR